LTVCGERGDCFFSERELNVNSRYMSSPVRLSSVCLSVTFVHRTQAIEIFGYFSSHLIRWPSVDIQVKFYEDRPRGTAPLGVKRERCITKYSEFGPFRGYISETVQDRR